MTFQSWQQIHYPISASELEKSGASDIELVKHSVIKWKGLRAEVLQAHGLQADADVIIPAEQSPVEPQADTFLLIDSDSCALCQRFYDYGQLCYDYDEALEANENVCDFAALNACSECPLRKTIGHPCFIAEGYPHETTEDTVDPYTAFITCGNPEPMIAALEATLQRLEQL
jgi:hypothetical protein